METCQNCGVVIGDLDTPYLWGERVVCHACLGRFQGKILTGIAAKKDPHRKASSLTTVKVAICAVFGLGFAGCIVLGIVLLLSSWGSRSAPTPKVAPVATVQPLTIKVTIWHERSTGQIEVNGRLVSDYVYGIRNDDEKPIVIQKVTYNGEFEAKPARELPAPSFRGSQSTVFVPKGELPVELTIGQLTYVFHQFDPNSDSETGNYDKDVIFMDIQTDRGNFRFRRGTQHIGFTGQPDWVLAHE